MLFFKCKPISDKEKIEIGPGTGVKLISVRICCIGCYAIYNMNLNSTQNSCE